LSAAQLGAADLHLSDSLQHEPELPQRNLLTIPIDWGCVFANDSASWLRESRLKFDGVTRLKQFPRAVRLKLLDPDALACGCEIPDDVAELPFTAEDALAMSE
jgi:hypothetical protein